MSKTDVEPAIPPDELHTRLKLVRASEYACYVKLKDIVKILEARRSELNITEATKLAEAKEVLSYRERSVVDYLHGLKRRDA